MPAQIEVGLGACRSFRLSESPGQKNGLLVRFRSMD